MQEKICCIFETDEQYAVKFAEAVNRNNGLPYPIMAYSSIEALLEVKDKYNVELLLIGDEVDSEIIEKISPARFFILSEEKSDLDNGLICKYQSTDRIVKQLLAGINAAGLKGSQQKLNITAVYSPAGKCFKSTIALGIAYHKARESKVLYINLEEFAAVEGVLEYRGRGLSDAMFYFISEKNNPMNKITTCISNAYGIDYFSPVMCPEDVADFKNDDFFELINLVNSTNGYNDIIIDVGNLISRPWAFLGRCNRIVIPEALDYVGKEKVRKFFDFIEKSSYKHIRNRMVEVRLDYNEELAGNSLTMAHINNTAMQKLCQGLKYG